MVVKKSALSIRCLNNARIRFLGVISPGVPVHLLSLAEREIHDKANRLALALLKRASVVAIGGKFPAPRSLWDDMTGEQPEPRLVGSERS